jgi:hypothetical protein
MNKFIRGVIVTEIVTLVGAGSIVLAHSPPQREMPHSEQEQHAPLDKGRHAIIVTATSAWPIRSGQIFYVQPRWSEDKT